MPGFRVPGSGYRTFLSWFIDTIGRTTDVAPPSSSPKADKRIGCLVVVSPAGPTTCVQRPAILHAGVPKGPKERPIELRNLSGEAHASADWCASVETGANGNANPKRRGSQAPRNHGSGNTGLSLGKPPGTQSAETVGFNDTQPPCPRVDIRGQPDFHY